MKAWLVLSIAFLTPSTAFASGLGKFVGGTTEARQKRCESPEPRTGFLDRTRLAVMPGITAELREPSQFSVYGDAGYRLISATTGCESSGGMLSGRNWWWHSLILGVDAELIPANPSDSPIGLMVAWDVRRGSSGFMSLITELLPFGFGVSAGPFYGGPARGVTSGGADWGIGASVFLRAIVDVRVGIDYNFGPVVASLHVGIVDPHLLVAAVIRELRD